MKFFKVLLVVALVFAVSTVAYAETQSVKVSGDITMRGIARDNYNLNEINDTNNNGLVSTNWASNLQSIAEIQIDADLTDNVSGVIRLVNQRVWGNGLYRSTGTETGSAGMPFMSAFTGVAVNPSAGAADPDNSFNIDVDLAYIELKEFLYSPLTLRIGRQDLWFGKGFIIGNSLTQSGTLFAPEYTALNSFDAIRATLDYDPWTIDAIMAKIAENGRRADDDTTLYGVNVGYLFDAYNAEAEAYWFYKQQRFTGSSVNALVTPNITGSANSNDVSTWGARGSFDPIEDWTVAVEAAYQTGKFIGAVGQVNRGRNAWAIDAMVECRYFEDQFAWKPVMAVEYIYYSGDSNIGNENTSSNGTYTGWDPMFRGKFDTAIREWQNVYYGTSTASTPAFTNQHQVLFKGSIEPTDSITVEGQYGLFWLAEDWATDSSTVPANGSKFIGQEIDISATWDYTEDVQFNLLTAWFFPGTFFGQDNGNGGKTGMATDIVGTVKLSF